MVITEARTVARYNIFYLHLYIINTHIFDYPDSRLSGLFTEVPMSPDNRGLTVIFQVYIAYFPYEYVLICFTSRLDYQAAVWKNEPAFISAEGLAVSVRLPLSVSGNHVTTCRFSSDKDCRKSYHIKQELSNDERCE